MSLLSRVGVFLVWAWVALWAAWGWVDGLLVRLAGPFGVRVADPARRYGLLLTLYGVIYVVGALPLVGLPLVALGVGYVGVLAVGRAWVANETARERLAKRLEDGDPDQMPDLRRLALAAA